jgi:hypothetical protein
MHAGYALIVGAALIHYAQRTVLRIAGALYPPFVLLVIVATGNHFLFDAATGAAVAPPPRRSPDGSIPSNGRLKSSR